MSKSQIIIFLISLMIFSSCGNDEEAGISIVGSWYGEYNYYNPAGGNKTQSLTIEFFADGSGELDYEAPTSISKAYFRYSVSDSEVKCNGVYASSYGDGEYDEDFNLILRISGDHLIPEGQYNMFVLSRIGGSNPTDNPNDKNTDYSKKLIKTWVGTDGKSILNIKSDCIETYIVNSREEYTYYCLHDYSDYYNRADQTIVFEGTKWFIKECTDNSLELNANGHNYEYVTGSWNDIPKKPDLQEYLPYIRKLETANGKFSLYFGDDNGITYFEDSGIIVNSKYMGKAKATLIADGKWEMSNRNGEIICYFESVSWHGDDLSENANLFPGWERRKSCIKYFKIEALTPTQFHVTLPNGGTYLMN